VQPAPKPHTPKTLLIIIAAVILVALAAAAYYFWKPAQSPSANYTYHTATPTPAASSLDASLQVVDTSLSDLSTNLSDVDTVLGDQQGDLSE
jgi:flagellar basal body-associated protein FliL